MLRIYLMTSPEFRGPVAAAVRDAGHETIDPPPASSDAGAAAVVPTLLKFDAVVFDFNVSKFRFFEAGWWRGRGVSVVYIAGPSKSQAADAAKYAARLGCYPCQSVDHFRAWLSSEPAFLMPPALDENGEHPEHCPACRGVLREHWNGKEFKCRACGRYFDGCTLKPSRPARAGGG